MEDAIECALLAGGEDECSGWPKAIREHPLAHGEGAPGGYHYKGEIRLDRGAWTIPPRGEKGRTDPVLPEPVEPLSEIIRDLNERFGTNFTDTDKVSIKGLDERPAGNDARLTFDHVVKDQLQQME